VDLIGIARRMRGFDERPGGRRVYDGADRSLDAHDPLEVFWSVAAGGAKLAIAKSLSILRFAMHRLQLTD
jgi:hypothetical protein